MNLPARPRRRATRVVEVCLACGATPTSARPSASECEHRRLGRVELTPRNARMLSQLRGAWAFARYMAQRFEQTVEVEALAGRASIAEESEPAPRTPKTAAKDTRQIPLFGE